MKQRRALSYWCLLLLAGSLGSCSDNPTYPLAGQYYTALSEDGEPRLYFDDPQRGPTYLTYAVAAGVAQRYVVACGDSCYLFPVAAATAEAARRAQIGPLTEAACRQSVRQLTGDSLHLAPVFY